MINEPVTLSTLGFGPPPKPKRGRRLKPKEVRHWICYHDPVTMKCSVPRRMFLDIVTRKKLNRRKLIDDVVHLITRVVKGDQYQLVGYFTVAHPDLLPKVRRPSSAVLRVGGTEGHQYRKRVPLNKVKWFRRYFDRNGLSHGFQRIKDPEILSGLINSTEKHRTRLVLRVPTPR